MRSSLLPLLVLAASLPARAAPVDPFTEPDEAALFRAEERVVTVASRFAQTVEQAPSLVTVITDAELRARGCRTLADALAEIPGVFITMSKEGRSLAWFRGVVSPDNSKILLLLDGVPWYDGVYAHAWIDEYVPLVNVKQIEVIKGPGSAVYGTNAFAGVINVVTYRAADLQGGFARAEVGATGAGASRWWWPTSSAGRCPRARSAPMPGRWSSTAWGSSARPRATPTSTPPTRGGPCRRAKAGGTGVGRWWPALAAGPGGGIWPPRCRHRRTAAAGALHHNAPPAGEQRRPFRPPPPEPPRPRSAGGG
jgi:hypothetical protein